MQIRNIPKSNKDGRDAKKECDVSAFYGGSIAYCL